MFQEYNLSRLIGHCSMDVKHIINEIVNILSLNGHCFRVSYFTVLYDTNPAWLNCKAVHLQTARRLQNIFCTFILYIII